MVLEVAILNVLHPFYDPFPVVEHYLPIPDLAGPLK
jgi:hypothetical protein